MNEILGGVLMLTGAGLTFIAGFGLVRLPSGLSRIHAAAKPASLGLALVAVGAGVASGSWGLMATGLLIAVLQFLTAPIAGHLLGRTLSPASGAETQELEVPPPVDEKSRRWALVVETVVLWIVLWRDLSLANVVAGTALGLVVAVIAPAGHSNYPRPLPALRAGFSYLGSLVRANARMAYQVLAVRDEDLMETLVVCDLETGKESVAFFDANATSFSPGTLTLEISQGVPYRMVVHAMGQTADEVKADVSHLEDSASRMFE